MLSWPLAPTAPFASFRSPCPLVRRGTKPHRQATYPDFRQVGEALADACRPTEHCRTPRSGGDQDGNSSTPPPRAGGSPDGSVSPPRSPPPLPADSRGELNTPLLVNSHSYAAFLVLLFHTHNTFLPSGARADHIAGVPFPGAGQELNSRDGSRGAPAPPRVGAPPPPAQQLRSFPGPGRARAEIGTAGAEPAAPRYPRGGRRPRVKARLRQIPGVGL